MTFGIQITDVNGDVFDLTKGAWHGYDSFTFSVTAPTTLNYNYAALIGDSVWVKVYRHGVASQDAITSYWNPGTGNLSITIASADAANPCAGTVFVFRAGITI